MASPSYTYTLTNGTTADASQVMQDFNDILNGVTDGTKSLSIAALTTSGTLTANGDVNLGDASGDTLTITASLGSTIPIKTTNSYDIGSATAGLRALYLGQSSSTRTGKLVVATHSSASRIYTVPDAGADANFVMTQGAQTLVGATTLSGGLVFGSGGTNLNNYQQSTTSSTFTFNGTGSPGTAGANVLRYSRVGDWVTLYVPAVNATTGTSSTTLTSNTALDAFARPSSITYTFAIGPMRDAGSSTLNVGRMDINSSGIITLRLTMTSAAFTNTSSGGLNGDVCVTYYVGTGS